MTTNTLTKVGFTINGEQLKEIKAAIKGLKHNKKTSYLETVRFSINEDQLVFEAQDLINYVKLTYKMDNNSTGQITLNKKVLKDMKLKKNDTATFEVEDDKTFNVLLNGLTVTHYLETYTNIHNEYFKNDLIFTTNDGYVESLKNSLKYVSTLETRPILQGIAHRNNMITCTDSHQMYQNEDLHSLDNGTIVVHSQTAKVVTDLYKKCNELTFTVSEYEHYVKYEGDHITVIGNLIEGNFPDTKRLFPQNFKTDLELNNSEIKSMIDTFKNMLTLITSRNNTIKLIISNNELTIKAMDIIEEIVNEKKVSKHVEKATNTFNNIVTSGDELEITINGKHLLNALEQQKGNNITIQFTGKLSPFQITTDTKEKYLYSPVRTY